MDFLIRFSQVHESFRKPEIEALAHLFNVDFEWLYYSEYVGSHSPYLVPAVFLALSPLFCLSTSLFSSTRPQHPNPLPLTHSLPFPSSASLPPQQPQP